MLLKHKSMGDRTAHTLSLFPLTGTSSCLVFFFVLLQAALETREEQFVKARVFVAAIISSMPG